MNTFKKPEVVVRTITLPREVDAILSIIARDKKINVSRLIREMLEIITKEYDKDMMGK